jgi:SAM-dependent methyltransferase
MALALPHIQLLVQLRVEGLIGRDSRRLLELGEQNWFGDVDPREILAIMQALQAPPAAVATVRADIERLLTTQPPTWLFDLAKLFYSVVFAFEDYLALDRNGTGAARSADLNEPVDLPGAFDVVTNLGTSEHVFNQYQFFKTMHEATRPGGLMIHSLPNQGGYDHGFYNYHPTFCFDLAAANGYDVAVIAWVDASVSPPRLVTLDRTTYVEMAVAGQLSQHSGLFAVFGKPAGNRPFQVPQQSYYAGTLPPALAEAWKRLRH